MRRLGIMRLEHTCFVLAEEDRDLLKMFPQNLLEADVESRPQTGVPGETEPCSICIRIGNAVNLDADCRHEIALTS